jgi:septal ring factor EnvC (AmiA/AmiB activator)
MTAEERFERIEQVTAALVEERRKDREEYRQLWRDTQRQIAELSLKIADTNDTVTRLAEDLTRQIRASDERAKAAEQELRDRISALVSAIGQFIQRP